VWPNGWICVHVYLAIKTVILSPTASFYSDLLWAETGLAFAYLSIFKC